MDEAEYWATICGIEPELAAIIAEAGAYPIRWDYVAEYRRAFKQQVARLVGFWAARDELRCSRAYNSTMARLNQALDDASRDATEEAD